MLGIDPGLKGGLAALTRDGVITLTTPMPVTRGNGSKSEIDVPALASTLRGLVTEHGVALVVVEHVGAMPKQGVVSTFTFGRGFGEVLGVVGTLGLPLELVRPQAWRKVVLAGAGPGKAAALAYARRRFPRADLRATPRSWTPSDGICDALCLAEFGRRLIGGSKT